jgi:predicted dehydrogenase
MEKPYTVSVKTGTLLAQAADRAGKVLATAVPHRRMPGQRAVHWAINEAKLIGEPRMFLSEYTQFRPPAPAGPVRPAMSWRRDRLMGGGYGVIDSGFHFLDTIQYFYGEVEQVYAELRAHGTGTRSAGRESIVDDREDTAVVVFRFKSGVVGTWVWSFAVPGRETRNIIIYGSEGSIEDTGYSNLFVIHHMFMGPGELRRRDGTYYSMEQLQSQMNRALGPERLQRIYPNGVTDHFAVELWDFVDAVLTGRKPEVDGWGGLATTALVESIYESAISGKSVSIEDVLSGKAYYGWQTAIDEYWDSQPIPKLVRG